MTVAQAENLDLETRVIWLGKLEGEVISLMLGDKVCVIFPNRKTPVHREWISVQELKVAGEE